MTIQGAMKELVNLLNADDIPIYYKGGIKKVIETIDDYINGEDDYVKRIRTKEHIVAESIADMGKDEPQTSKIIEAYAKGFEDGAEAVKAMPQTETEIAKAIVHKMINDAVIAEDAYPDLRQKMHDAVDADEPQTERSE